MFLDENQTGVKAAAAGEIINGCMCRRLQIGGSLPLVAAGLFSKPAAPLLLTDLHSCLLTFFLTGFIENTRL